MHNFYPINVKLESDCGKKDNDFKKFFAWKCTLLNNGRTLLIPFKYASSHYLLNTWAVELSSFVNKTHGCDDISFCIIKLCDQWIVKPLSVIYWNCLNTYIFKGISNIVPVCKKGDKKVINDYQPASLMMVCGKILERLVFNLIFDFRDNSSLFSANQLGFRPSDSCESQLLPICHEIYTSFFIKQLLRFRGVFLGVSKTFDRVCYEGLICKIKWVGIYSPLLKLIESFLSNRYCKYYMLVSLLHGYW